MRKEVIRDEFADSGPLVHSGLRRSGVDSRAGVFCSVNCLSIDMAAEDRVDGPTGVLPTCAGRDTFLLRTTMGIEASRVALWASSDGATGPVDLSTSIKVERKHKTW